MLLPFLQIIVMFTCFSTVFIFGKQNLLYSEPFFLTGVRMSLAGILMLAYLFMRGDLKWHKVKDYPLEVFVFAFFGIFLTNGFEFWGLKYLPPARTSFLFCLVPFGTCLISYFILKEKITPLKGVGLSLGLAGVFLIIFPDLVTEGITTDLADLSVLTAMLCTSYSWIFLRRGHQKRKISTLHLNAFGMTLGGAFLLALSFFTEQWSPVPVTDTARFWQWMIPTLIFSNLIAFNLYVHLLRTFTASFIAFTGMTCPYITALLQWGIFGEAVSWTFILSSAITFFGFYLFYKEELEQGYILSLHS